MPPYTKKLESLDKSTRANMFKQIKDLGVDAPERNDSKEEEDAENSFKAREKRQNENIKMLERMRRERSK